jgi:hypothetical protein
LHNPPANGKQGLKLEEMSHTLLTNKKQGHVDYVHAANIIKPTQTRINGEKYTFCVIKSLEYLKNLKVGRLPYLGIELTIDHTLYMSSKAKFVS